MPDNVVIPGWVWVVGVRVAVTGLAGLGLLVVAVFWKTGKLPFSGGSVRGEKAGPDRRSNDVIVTKLVDALVAGGQKIAQEMQELSSAIREQTKSNNDGFRDLHRKVEVLSANKGGSHVHG